MYFEVIATPIFKEVQSKNNTSHVNPAGGGGFIESLNDVAMRSQMVVRGNQLSSAGLHERKMVNDWNTKLSDENEELFNGIFAKIDRIEELLKQKFEK
jgi:hypothetical protein